MFATLLPEKIYEKNIRRMVNNLVASNRPRVLDYTKSIYYLLCQSPFHRTVLVGSHSLPPTESFHLSVNTTHIEGACLYLPTYLRSQVKLTGELKDPNINLVYPFKAEIVPLISKVTGVEYSDYLVVTFLACSEADMEVSKVYALLYQPLLQACLKGIPLFVHELAVSPSFKRHLKGIGFTKINSHPTHTGYVLWPENLLLNLYEDIEDLILINNPRCATVAPTLDKFGSLHRMLQIDRPLEFNIGATMLSRAFLDDPLKIVIQPQSQYSSSLLFDLTRYLFSVSSYRGLCVATVNCDNKGRQVLQMARSETAEQYPNQIEYDSFSSCMISNPPGQVSGHWGSTLNLVKIYTSAGVSAKNLSCLAAIEKMHSLHCGNPENHFYICWIAASVAFKGYGLGGYLVDWACALSDLCKAYLYLENSKLANIGFYNKYGLTVKHMANVSRALHETYVYFMLREVNLKSTRPIARVWAHDERRMREHATSLELK